MDSARLRFSKWQREWRQELYQHKYLILLSLVMIALAEWVCFRASTYVDGMQMQSVPDLILNNIPSIDLSAIFIYGFMGVLVILLVYSLIFKIKEFHEIAFIFCLLVLVRSIFITLTHIGVPEDAIRAQGFSALYQSFNFRNDLFFSGHAAMPFMGFLVFRKEAIGIFFLVMTIILSATVLLMHLHYSIDVFSAFFITFGVYKLGEWMIKNIIRKHWQLAS